MISLNQVLYMCGNAAAVNDNQVVGADYKKLKESLGTVLRVHSSKLPLNKDSFVLGYTSECLRIMPDFYNQNENKVKQMADIAFDLLLQDTGTH